MMYGQKNIKSSWTTWPLRMGPNICPETSARNYRSMPRNSQKRAGLFYTLSVYDDIFTALPYVSTHHRYRIWEWNPVNGINITFGNKRNIYLIVSKNNGLFYVCYKFNGFPAVSNRRGSTVVFFILILVDGL